MKDTMNLKYYVDVPVVVKWFNGTTHNDHMGFYLDGCHIDKYLPGVLICDYACHHCYDLQEEYNDVRSIDELKRRLAKNGINPMEWSV